MKVNNTDEVDNLDTGENTPEDSSPENKSPQESQPEEGKDNTPPNKPLAFHEDPKVQDYIERQVEQRGEKMRATITAEIEAKLKGFQPIAPKEENARIPEWFGGDEKQWKAYQADQNRILSEAEKRAEDRAYERLNSTRNAESKAVQDANKHFESSITKIEAEKKVKIDRNELLQYVLENRIIDIETQRWDYEKGYRWMTAEKAAANPKGGNRQSRKDLAAATTDDTGKGEPDAKTFKTSEDFKNSSERPW